MLKTREILLQENLQCKCFEPSAPEFKFFLSRSVVMKPQQHFFAKKQNSSLLQGSNSSSIVKKSLKGGFNLFKNLRETNQGTISSTDIKSTHSQEIKKNGKESLRKDIEGKRVIPITSDSGGSLQQNKHNFPSKPIPDNNKQRLGHPLTFSSEIVSPYSAGHPRISFCIGGQISKAGRTSPLKDTDEKTEDGGFTPMTKCSSMKNFSILNPTSLKQPEEQTCFKMSRVLNQQEQEEKPSAAVKPSTDKKRQILKFGEKVNSNCFYSCDLNKELHIKKFPQEKTKMSLVKSRKEGSRHGEKRVKLKSVLKKMSEVSEIESLMDEEEVEESDQESVVLGRLNEYSGRFPLSGSTIPQLDKEYEESSISSTAMTVPGEGFKLCNLQRTII